jgi:hypothetical protein
MESGKGSSYLEERINQRLQLPMSPIEIGLEVPKPY